VNPTAIDRLVKQWQSPDADELQASLDAVRTIFQKRPMIAALKRAIAHWSGDEAWSRVRPPLVELGTEQAAALISELEAVRFAMPGLDPDRRTPTSMGKLPIFEVSGCAIHTRLRNERPLTPLPLRCYFGAPRRTAAHGAGERSQQRDRPVHTGGNRDRLSC